MYIDQLYMQNEGPASGTGSWDADVNRGGRETSAGGHEVQGGVVAREGGVEELP
jgi:hypothetical protein